MMIAALASIAVGQSSVEKVVDAEHDFARMAADNGTKAAFLAFMTDEAVVFNPAKVNAKSSWSSRKESPALLLWDPNYADISSDGAIGYTTGNWEYRPKGKADAPVAFGDFVTVWTRQANGDYKWVIDMGVSHDRPVKYSTDWVTTKHAPSAKAAANIDKAVEKFAAITSRKGLAAAYKEFGAEDIRSYRDGKMPLLGKAAAMAEANGEAGKLAVDISTHPTRSSDLAYLLTDYTRATADGKAEKGNMMQIWKFYDGKWHVVLDVIIPVPAK